MADVKVVKTRRPPVVKTIAAPMAAIPVAPPETAAESVAEPTPEPMPDPVVAPVPDTVIQPATALAAAPVQVAEATRATVEDAGSAIASAIETVADHVTVVSAYRPMTNPMKGFMQMATTFDPKAFAPNPEAMKSMFGDVQGRAKDQMEKGAKIVEEMSDFAKGNVEAMMASGRVAAKGTETMAQDAAEFGKKSFEHATTAFKGFAQAKSPTELFKLQSDYARATFDAMVAESSKVTEAWLKLAGEVAQPLSSRVAVAAEKAKTPTAL